MNRLLGLLLAAACGSGSDSTPTPDGLTDAVATRTIHGAVTIRWVTTLGEVVTPVDLSGRSVSVVALPSLDSFSGTTNPDGTFFVPDVPVGKVLLKLGFRYLEMSGDDVDLVTDALGRPNPSIATSLTTLRFDVDNLSPWQASDELQMFCPSSGTVAWQMQIDATGGKPGANDISLTAFTYDLSRASEPALIAGSQGDQLRIVQLATTTDGTRTYRTVARSLTPSAFDVTNGVTTALSGTFAAVNSGSSLGGVWDRPAFDTEIVANGSPSIQSNWSTLAVSALPEAGTRGFYWGAPDVLIFAPGHATDHTAVTMSWPIGDPYPAEWTRIVWVRYFRYHYVQLGSAAPLAVSERLLVYRELSTISSQSPIIPIVGMVIDPLINGMNAKQAVVGVGTTPTISWTVPKIGTASRYYVDIYQLSILNGATIMRRTVSMETSSTEIVVPPSILTTGQTYLIEISARSADLNPEATPNRRTLPEGWSTVTSGVVTP